MEDKLTPLEAEVMEVSARQEPEQAFDSWHGCEAKAEAQFCSALGALCDRRNHFELFGSYRDAL